jgi:hypothetical protein
MDWNRPLGYSWGEWATAGFLTGIVGFTVGARFAQMDNEPEQSASTIYADKSDPAHVVQQLNRYHNGVYAVCNDRDFDRDGVFDAFIIANDRTLYATHPSEDKHVEGVGTM